MRLVVGLIVRIISLKKPRCWCVTVRMSEVPLAKNELCILYTTYYYIDNGYDDVRMGAIHDEESTTC